jgi:hypothetical protein
LSGKYVVHIGDLVEATPQKAEINLRRVAADATVH